ncbi:cyclic nucleotide-binding domain-containing protein 2 isoform X3 [Bactrocera dorsalis]|uniref:Cyclic nucleotide-binding domain-containing protein 2 isoform X3 n=1 Tax=Bactrocera dorsalis TaxID=27457 RepID=A0ABM3J448_BACDO|nr:cyclic nucleotide-binding domain-containing protein 2 isoform X3 [Bactrocera dorsalis]
MYEKNILHKYRELRSDSERESLVNLMAHLTVFSQIPPKLRARLAPYAYFIILGPKRKIIEQGREPATVYFVLTGDITVTTKIWNSVKNKYIERLEYLSGPGEWLGEIDFLENQKRQQTFTSKSEVELLALDREDFERILLPYLKKTWEHKKSVLRYLGYFDFFTNEQIVSACQLASLQQFEPYETIYHEDKGLETFVYFVISGTCMVLQCLEIKVAMTRKWKKFELVDIVKSEDIFRNLSLAEIRSHMRVKSMFSFSTISIVEDESQSDEDTYISVQQQRKKIRTLEKQCALGNPDKNFELPSELGSLSSLISYSTLKPEGHEHSENSRSEENGEFPFLPGEESLCSYDYFSKSESNIYTIGNSPGKHTTEKKLMETKIENHFIDVGTISKGGIFGLGEAMKHRIIMAETRVQCLVIPRYWLFQDEQNPANMWQRKKIQLDFTLPSREALFSLFQNSHKWQNFKKGIVSSFRTSETKLQDIPIMGRIMSCDQ